MRFVRWPSKRDVFLAWGWLPFFATTAVLGALQTRAGNAGVIAMVGIAFTLSLLHQPLTLLIIARDRSAFAGRRHWLLWMPLVALPFVGAAVLAKVWLVVPIGAAWQIFHTQQQRYGMLRRYDRESTPSADRLITYAPFLATLAALASLTVTRDHLRMVGHRLGQNNFRAISGTLDALPRSALVVALALVVSVLVVFGYALNDARRPISVAKWNYLVSGFALLGGLLVSPAAGLVAYLVAHATEYTTVVHQRIATRATSWLAPLVSVASVIATFAVTNALLSHALPGRGYGVIAAGVGVLHFFYDGFVWKRPKHQTSDAERRA